MTKFNAVSDGKSRYNIFDKEGVKRYSVVKSDTLEEPRVYSMSSHNRVIAFGPTYEDCIRAVENLELSEDSSPTIPAIWRNLSAVRALSCSKSGMVDISALHYSETDDTLYLDAGAPLRRGTISGSLVAASKHGRNVCIKLHRDQLQQYGVTSAPNIRVALSKIERVSETLDVYLSSRNGVVAQRLLVDALVVD